MKRVILDLEYVERYFFKNLAQLDTKLVLRRSRGNTYLSVTIHINCIVAHCLISHDIFTASAFIRS